MLIEKYGIEDNTYTLRNKFSSGTPEFLFNIVTANVETLTIEQVKNMHQKIKNDL